MAELRDYQERAIEKLRAVLRSGSKRPVMVLPTGAGKSIIFGQIISNILDNGKKVLWIVHRRNLVNQMRDVLREHFEIDSGIIMAGIESETEKPVQLCTIQTFIRRMDLDSIEYNRFMINADVVLIDEGHRSIAKSYQKVIEEYKDKIIMACTATPMRGDQRGLGEVYDSIVDIANVRELTEKGYLAPARYFAPVNIDLTGVKTAMGDYVVKDLDGKVNRTKLIGDIVQNWLKLAENRKTIVYAVNVKHSKAICEEFNKHGIAAEHLDAHSSDDERDKVFERMQRGDITVITNVALYQEGLDVPDVSCIVMARPTKSMGLYRQCCGRGLRPSPEKKDCLVLDHGNVIETHGLLDWEIEWILDGKKKAWSKPSKRLAERLVKCRVCHKVFMGARVCPDCGTPVVSFGKKIVTVEADLEEIKEKPASVTDKRIYLGMLKYWVWNQGKNPKMIMAKYKSKFGVWPHHSIQDVEPIKPDQAFLNLMKHDIIRYIKAKQKEEKIAERTLNRGGELAREYNKLDNSINF